MSDAASCPFSSPGRAPAAGDLAPRVGVERDPRADGRRREVEFTPQGVVLTRRLAGMTMRVGVPAGAYRGVGLGVIVEDGLPAYAISLRHDDADLCARLALLHDRDDAFAALAGWADWFDLPGMIERPDGRYVDLDDERSAARRRRPVARRPRFLNRRKPGQIERMALRHAGEREIIARD